MKYERGSFITVGSRDTLRGLHPTAQCLYMWLCSYANETGNCFPSRKTLARDCGCSEDSVDKMLTLLGENGLVVKKNQKNGDAYTSNLYTVLIGGGSRSQPPPSPLTATTLPARNGTNSNHVTQTNEPAVAKPPAIVVSSSESEERPKRESRTEDKLAIYRLFSSREQPWWRHAQQKKAALSLFDLVGIEKVRAGLQKMKENEDDPYCPQASTPFDYEVKLPKLSAYAKRTR